MIVTQKIMKHISILLLLSIFLLTGCSADRLVDTSSNKAHLVVDKTSDDGSIPRSKLVYTVLYQPNKFTVIEMDEMYRKDILDTAPDYGTNLKNMWFVIMNERLAKEADKNLKIFYLNEQINMDQNLATIEGFYKLLQSCSSFMSVDEIFGIAAAFQEKNKDVIENVIQWKDVKSKETQLADMTYENVKFQRSMVIER